jgi:hypothetical protein
MTPGSKGTIDHLQVSETRIQKELLINAAVMGGVLFLKRSLHSFRKEPRRRETL